MNAGTVARDQWPAQAGHRAGIAPVCNGTQMSEPALRGQLRQREPMARHVSWRAGGAADQAYLPADLADLQAFLRTRATGEPIWFVGLGSNLLVRDRGLRGTVVLTHRGLRRFEVDHGRREVVAEAGVACPRIARVAAVNGLAGAEFLAGIPGTLGGALAMNAGCYGGETWHVVAHARTIDRRGDLHERVPTDYDIGYRSVVRREAGGKMRETREHAPRSSPLTPYLVEEWFVGATLRLEHGDSAAAREHIRELLALRLASQPLNQPNAGSVFRNPPGDHAARLIEACGLKGHAIGGAMISSRHANFIVTTGTACAADIEALIDLARHAVKEKFGIELEREVRIIGEA
jgi:UDP-N-acetylmuramate dehydrogenase